MPNPDQERMDALSEAILRVLRRQAQLDQRLARIEATLGLQPIVSEAPPVAPPAPSSPEPAPEEVAVAPPSAPPRERPPALETNIGLTVVNRIGVITLVLGMAFFFKWAVDNQWIGPAGRVVLGLTVGLVALAAGDWLWQKGQRTFAQGITAVGLGILYLAVYAAFTYYRLVPQGVAFTSMVAFTVLGAALALRYTSVAMAVLGLLGGYLTPILLSTGEDHPWFLFSYILVLNVAALMLARMRQWGPLEILGLVATVAVFGIWLNEKFTPEKQFVATFFVLVYYALFTETLVQWLVPIAQIMAAAGIARLWVDAPGVYLFLTLLLALGGLVVFELRRIKGAAIVTFGAYWSFYGMWISTVHLPRPISTLFLGLTGAFILFFAWMLWRSIYRREPAGAEELAIVALNAAAYFGASYTLLDKDHHARMGLFAVAIAAAHLALAAGIKRAEARPPDQPSGQRAMLLSLGVAVALVTLAVPIQFTAYRITMAWSLEFLALFWIGLRMKNAPLKLAAVAVSMLVWVRLGVLDSWTFSDPSSYSLIANARFLTFLIAAACSCLAAYWSRPNAVALTEYLAGHAILLWGLSLEVLGWAGRTSAAPNLLSVETVAISILFAVYAVVLVSAGVATRTVINRVIGLSLIGVVVIKLYLFDVWQLGRVYRISAFVALGALLLATSFLYSHFRALIESWWKDDRA